MDQNPYLNMLAQQQAALHLPYHGLGANAIYLQQRLGSHAGPLGGLDAGLANAFLIGGEQWIRTKV